MHPYLLVGRTSPCPFRQNIVAGPPSSAGLADTGADLVALGRHLDSIVSLGTAFDGRGHHKEGIQHCSGHLIRSRPSSMELRRV